ncbi:MAG: alpha-amylase [Firmicutes bacterium]|nr:alpha-amylase [Bacillota bacterium]
MNKTKIELRNSVVYQVFVRNHTLEGTFQALILDLDRIQSLGVDIIYLLPIHPIGEKNRKGTIGCPYSIQNYKEIHPELGTMEDFKQLIEEIHNRKMKLMMDIVYNHTSRDSKLLKEHPDWFYKNEKGEFANRIGEWWDVTDFDFTEDKSLWRELAENLVFYAELGVDGFRADVASLVPLDFWNYARKVVSRVNKKVIWLSESVHGSFLKYIRDCGYDCSSESEIYQVFDIAYDYDVQPFFEAYLKNERPFKEYLEAISRQEEIYPANYVKLKNLENHDQERIAFQVKNDINKILNWTGFIFFQKGATMLYAGEEFTSDKRPDLFEKDVYVKNTDITDYIQKLTKLKKRKVFSSGVYTVHIPEIDGVAYNTFENNQEKYIGIFNVALAEGNIKVDFPDGTYHNYLTGKQEKIESGLLKLSNNPVVIKIKK